MTSLSTENLLQNVEAFDSPGQLLQSVREAQGMTRREVADALNFIPSYVQILEEDDYTALANPGFARGYLRTYGRLLGIAPEQLLPLYDEVIASSPDHAMRRIETKPLQLQATGVGIVVGLTTLVLVVALLWLMRGTQTSAEQALNVEPVDVVAAGSPPPVSAVAYQRTPVERMP